MRRKCRICDSDLLVQVKSADGILSIHCAACGNCDREFTKQGTALCSGVVIDIFDTFSISDKDIAHSLANQCRYNGHTKDFYSVAEHCCLLYDKCKEPWALLHDSAEAYIGDMIPQIKDSIPYLLDSLEYEILERVAEHYGLSLPFPNIVTDLDKQIRVNELFDIDVSIGGVGISGLKLQYWPPRRAEVEFLSRLEDVKNELSKMSKTDDII